MKKFYFICLILFLGANTGRAFTWMKPHVNLPLKQLVNKPTAKSAPAYLPVEVELYATRLELSFNSNLGNLNIVVVNQWGFPVYQQTVDATAGSSLVIDMKGWASGTYTIFILDGQGGGFEGQFVK